MKADFDKILSEKIKKELSSVSPSASNWQHFRKVKRVKRLKWVARLFLLGIILFLAIYLLAVPGTDNEIQPVALKVSDSTRYESGTAPLELKVDSGFSESFDIILDNEHSGTDNSNATDTEVNRERKLERKKAVANSRGKEEIISKNDFGRPYIGKLPDELQDTKSVSGSELDERKGLGKRFIIRENALKIELSKLKPYQYLVVNDTLTSNYFDSTTYYSSIARTRWSYKLLQSFDYLRSGSFDNKIIPSFGFGIERSLTDQMSLEFGIKMTSFNSTGFMEMDSTQTGNGTHVALQSEYHQKGVVIPIALKYRFKPSQESMYFSIGLVSSFSLSENFKTTTKTTDLVGVVTTDIINANRTSLQSNYYLGHLRLGLGKQFYISKHSFEIAVTYDRSLRENFFTNQVNYDRFSLTLKYVIGKKR